jgi:hypothetical protein
VDDERSLGDTEKRGPWLCFAGLVENDATTGSPRG